MAERPGDLASASLLGLTILAWGGNYLFVRVGEAYVHPVWLAAMRASIGAIGVAVYLRLVPRPEGFGRAEVRDALLLGVPNTGAFLGLWFVAAPAIPPGEAAVVIYTFPLWVALFSPRLLGLRLRPAHWVAVGAGFSGIVVVSEPWTLGLGAARLLPLVELLAAAVCWALPTVLFQRRFPSPQLARANGWQLVGGATVLLVFGALFGETRTPLDAPTFWLALAWLGLFGTAFAYGVWFHLLRRIPAASLATYTFLVPLVALALGVAFIGERVSLVQAGGIALVLFGVYLVGRSSASA